MLENNMLRYQPDPPPPPECDICGGRPYKIHDNKLLCYHCWVKSIAESASPHEVRLYIQQNRSEFCKYIESAIKSSALDWDEFIYSAWGDKCTTDDRYNAILGDYINDCDRSDLAEQIEKWRQ